MANTTWGNQHQAVLNRSDTTTPTYLHDYLEYTQDIWHGFSKNIKVDFLGSEISADPPEPPLLWSEISASETKNDPKISREILYKLT